MSKCPYCDLTDGEHTATCANQKGLRASPAYNNIVGQIWEHYANKRRYMVSSIATNPNNAEQVVVYWGVTDNHGREHAQDYWRPLNEFLKKFRLVHE